MEKIIKEITKKFDLETLDTRNSDSLDFKDIAIWNLKEMITMAFEAGKKSQDK